MRLFDDETDYAAFSRVLMQAVEREPGARLLGYCLMPNHWHLVLWPRRDGQLSQFMRWLTVTHTQRWHAHRHTSGTGPVYQGRFKSFPIEQDDHLLTVLRYVERNALRGKLVACAEDWRWSSLWRWTNRHKVLEDIPVLSDWPVDRRRGWTAWVNEPMSQAELEAVRQSVKRGTPWGGQKWVVQTAGRLSLLSTLRPIGRPRKPKEDAAP
ncbi:MAG: transposase [Phycisphaerales bacterium]